MAKSTTKQKKSQASLSPWSQIGLGIPNAQSPLAPGPPSNVPPLLARPPSGGHAAPQAPGPGQVPPAPAAAPGGFDMAAIIAALNAPRGRHLGIGGAEMTEANPMGNSGGDPWTNGFFKPMQPMQAVPDAARLAGFKPNSGGRLVADPFDEKGGLLPGVNPFAPLLPPQTITPNPVPTGFGEAMINPQLPDDQKYLDANFWSAGLPKPLPKKPAAIGVNFGTNRRPFSF